MAAALDLFGTVGYANSPIETLCVESSVSTRSFYDDIGSREALLIALVDSITASAATKAAEAWAASADQSVAVRLERAFSAYLQVTCADHRSARVCYVEVIGVSQAVENWRQGWRDRVVDLFEREAERLVEKGLIHARDFRIFALAMIGAVNSLGQVWAVDGVRGELSIDIVAAELAGLATAGLERR